MFYCKELDRNFETKEELFAALRESHKEIIEDKRARIYNSRIGENKGGINVIPINKSKIGDSIKEINLDDDYYYIAVNTTLILDSHEDMHLNGSWNKTAKDQKGKVYLVWDHELKGSSTIVRKEYIELLILEIPFAALGYDYKGNTEALVYKFRKDKVIDQKAKEWLDSGDEIQASVRMQYIKMAFALDSKEDEDKELKKNFDQYYPQIANKDDFENDILYFWPIIEAANKLESSLVLFGSNHVTGQMENEKKKPQKSTSNHNEPSISDTQRKFYLGTLKS